MTLIILCFGKIKIVFRKKENSKFRWKGESYRVYQGFFCPRHSRLSHLRRIHSLQLSLQINTHGKPRSIFSNQVKFGFDPNDLPWYTSLFTKVSSSNSVTIRNPEIIESRQPLYRFHWVSGKVPQHLCFLFQNKFL